MAVMGAGQLLVLRLLWLWLMEMAISVIVVGECSATVAAVTRRGGKATAVDHNGHGLLVLVFLRQWRRSG